MSLDKKMGHINQIIIIKYCVTLSNLVILYREIQDYLPHRMPVDLERVTLIHEHLCTISQLPNYKQGGKYCQCTNVRNKCIVTT